MAFNIINWTGTVIKTFESRLSAEVYLFSIPEEEAEDYYITEDVQFDTFPINEKGESENG